MLRAYHERFWHILRYADNAAALLAGVEKISGDTARGTFLNIKNADNIVLFHGGVSAKKQIHSTTPP